jgi:hypothetical protein
VTVHDVALAALAEVNPAARAALAAAGANAVGHSCIGYLGWMPDQDLRDATAAVMLAHERAGYPSFGADGLLPLMAGLRKAIWRHPRDDRERDRIAGTVTAWGEALGRDERTIEQARLDVAEGRAL